MWMIEAQIYTIGMLNVKAGELIIIAASTHCVIGEIHQQFTLVYIIKSYILSDGIGDNANPINLITGGAQLE